MNQHGRLRIQAFSEPLFQENGYLLWCAQRPECWIIDPGFPPQAEQIAAAIAAERLRPLAMLLTHCHPDHIAGVGALRRALPGVAIWAPRDEQHMLGDPQANLSSQLGLAVSAPPADRSLAPGDTLELAELAWQALDVSGHSPGGLAYYCPEAGVVLAGDALFAGSIGRYDFPHSSRQRLLANLRHNLLTLPGETVLYSGHGPATTIARERSDNLTLRMELES